MKRVLVLLIIACMSLPAWGQCNCDINNDGRDSQASDLTGLIMRYNASPDLFYACEVNCDADGDDILMTIADFNAFLYCMEQPYGNIPEYGFNPDLDTLKFASVWGMPGQQLSIPLYFSTVDTIMGFDILANVDNSVLTVNGFTSSGNLEFSGTHNDQLLHLYRVVTSPDQNPQFIMPGEYLLGELTVNVAEDITEPVTTLISFQSCPEGNFHTGLANNTFFRPVLVDGVVTITTTDIDDKQAALPVEASISAYPNPFNLSTTISVEGISRGEVKIYNISGQLVEGLTFGASGSQSNHNILWEAVDSKGKPLPTGVYLAVINYGNSQKITKLNLIK